jgi:hypothetical protein
MQIGTLGGIEVRLPKGPDGGGNIASREDLNKSLNNYSLLLAPGVLGGIFALIVYPPLDQGLLVRI